MPPFFRLVGCRLCLQRGRSDLTSYRAIGAPLWIVFRGYCRNAKIHLLPHNHVDYALKNTFILLVNRIEKGGILESIVDGSS